LKENRVILTALGCRDNEPARLRANVNNADVLHPSFYAPQETREGVVWTERCREQAEDEFMGGGGGLSLLWGQSDIK